MDDIEQQLSHVRQQIARLRMDLQAAEDETARYQIHAQLNTCIRESLRLINQRSGALPHERSVGDGGCRY